MVAEVVLLGQARSFKVIKIIYQIICVGAIAWQCYVCYVNSCYVNERDPHGNHKAHTCNQYAYFSKYIQRPINLLSYLLGELILDDAHNSAGRLNIDALRLELGKGIHSNVLNLDGKNVTAIGQLSQLALVIELAIEDVLPTNNEGGRRVGTRRVQEGHGKIEPRCLERHHSTELSSSDASHAKGGRIGGNVATGHVGVEPSGVAMITVRV